MTRALYHPLPVSISQHALSAFAGCMANIQMPFIKNYLIRDFIRRYDVNMQEAVRERPEEYASFNDFFIRHLKPSVRPRANAEIISPVDGYVSEIGEISQGRLLQAKGSHYTVHELLACEERVSSAFEQGAFATLYLSPKDYHRIHMPLNARVREMIHVPGTLFAVKPSAVRTIPGLFARNERLVVLFDTEIGLMAMVLVGALIVGAIGTSWGKDVKRYTPQHTRYSMHPQEQIVLHQGDEMGYFKLGSTVIVLFENAHHLHWRSDLHSGDRLLFGEKLGSFRRV